MGVGGPQNMNSKIDYEPLDRDHAPTDGFQIGGVRELVPDDITTTPPLTAKLYFSEEFTDEDESERTYVLEIAKPAGLENNVIRMEGVPTVHGTRLFRKYLDGLAQDRGYEVETVPLVDYLERNE